MLDNFARIHEFLLFSLGANPMRKRFCIGSVLIHFLALALAHVPLILVLTVLRYEEFVMVLVFLQMLDNFARIHEFLLFSLGANPMKKRFCIGSFLIHFLALALAHVP